MEQPNKPFSCASIFFMVLFVLHFALLAALPVTSTLAALPADQTSLSWLPVTISVSLSLSN